LAADTTYTTEWGAAAIRMTEGRSWTRERVRFTATTVRTPIARSRRRAAETA